MKRKGWSLVFLGMLLGAAGALVAQQEYPNEQNVSVLLENDKVVVQRVDFEAGKWAGEHKHAGNQLVVVLDAMEVMYKEGEDEVKASYKAGAVYWVEAGTHDHAAAAAGTGLLITIK